MMRTLETRFAVLSQREKLMMLLAGAALILLVGMTYFVEPAWRTWSRAETDRAEAQAHQRSLMQQIGVYAQALRDDPDAALQDRLAKLQADYDALQQNASEQLNALVLPSEMPALIDRVLASADGLTLQRLTSLPPVNLLAVDTPASQTSNDATASALYQHSVELAFTGTYFNVLRFLQRLEEKAGPVYWQRLDYRVSAYPTAEVTLTLFTLSTRKAFIGVE